MAESQRDRLQKLVWKNEVEELKSLLEKEETKGEINAHDVRGNTPLILAIMLGRQECIELLLQNGASCLTKNKLGWQPLHEARSYGNRDVIKAIIRYRRIQMEKYVVQRSERTIEKIKELDDFSMDMRWDFSSWIPFVSRFCPSDVYQIRKKGAFVRVDTTLKGFENLKWVRGQISFIYLGEGGELGTLYILDHERKVFEKVKNEDREEKIEERINFLMNTKIRFGDLNHAGIAFQRSKTGVLGMGSGKTESVGAFEADVYSVSGVKVKSHVRSEHLTILKRDKSEVEVEKVEELLEQDSEGKEEEIIEKVKKFELNKKDSDLEKMIGEAKKAVLKFRESLPPPPPPSISFDEYFFPELTLKKESSKGLRISSSSLSLSSLTSSLGLGSSSSDEGKDKGKDKDKDAEDYLHVGRPLVLQSSSRSFKANLWMSSSFPLFVEQLLPILEILAPSNKHFKTLKEFIELRLPRGFPIKIEIPLFGVLTAKVTFQNFEMRDDLPDSIFAIPEDYVEGEVKMQN